MKCADCNKRKAIINYSDEGIFAMTHGYGIIHICRHCYLKRLLEMKKALDENVRNQKLLLKKGGRKKYEKTK